MTPDQQSHIDRLRRWYHVVRTMPLGDGRLVAFPASIDGQPGPRYLLPVNGTAAREAAPEDVRRAQTLATGHLRHPCPACGYPAKQPACARCGKVLAYAA